MNLPEYIKEAKERLINAHILSVSHYDVDNDGYAREMLFIELKETLGFLENELLTMHQKTKEGIKQNMESIPQTEQGVTYVCLDEVLEIVENSNL